MPEEREMILFSELNEGERFDFQINRSGGVTLADDSRLTRAGLLRLRAIDHEAMDRARREMLARARS